MRSVRSVELGLPGPDPKTEGKQEGNGSATQNRRRKKNTTHKKGEGHKCERGTAARHKERRRREQHHANVGSSSTPKQKNSGLNFLLGSGWPSFLVLGLCLLLCRKGCKSERFPDDQFFKKSFSKFQVGKQSRYLKIELKFQI